MIFGLTHAEQKEIDRRYALSRCVVKKWFALFPTQMHDGKMVWLQSYYVLPNIWTNCEGLPEVKSFPPFWFETQRYYTKKEAMESYLYMQWVERGWAKTP